MTDYERAARICDKMRRKFSRQSDEAESRGDTLVAIQLMSQAVVAATCAEKIRKAARKAGKP